MKKIFFSLFVISLLISGVIALAENSELPSPGITPDSPFYFLKIWKEQIQLFFIFDAENKAKQYLHLADVRLAEYLKMIEKGKTEIAQKTLEKYEKQLSHALEKIQELKQKGQDVKDISQELATSTLKHIEILQRNLQKVPETGKKGIENAIKSSSKVFEKVMGRSEKEQKCIDSGGTVATSTCCISSSDFPNLCLIGPCGCSLENSHQVKICDCGPDKCFDGEECKTIEHEEQQAVCENKCGDGICQEVVCMAIGCPCPETKESCPQDCQ